RAPRLLSVSSDSYVLVENALADFVGRRRRPLFRAGTRHSGVAFPCDGMIAPGALGAAVGRRELVREAARRVRQGRRAVRRPRAPRAGREPIEPVLLSP